MKNKRNDLILNAAFDRQALKDAMSSEEEAELVQLAKIKNALSSLKNVPECQLSNERLRNAILDKGVRRKSTIGWTTFGAVAACAFVSVIILNSQQVQPPMTKVAVIEESEPTFENVLPNINDSETEASLPPATIQRVRPTGKSLNKRSALKDRSSKMADHRPVADNALLVNASMAPSAPIMEDAIVVVDSQIIAETGAYEAVELEANGDVVFGG